MFRTPEVIVAMTTYPPRIGTIWQAWQPLLRQTVAPDRLVLCLAKDDFPVLDGEDAEAIGALQSAGVEVQWAPRTLGPHDKYFWVMRDNPDAVVITVDDDQIYPLDLVQKLLEAHFRCPSAVVACRTHQVKVAGPSEGSDDGGAARLVPYAEWSLEQREHLAQPRHDLMATGVGGVLYPPRAFDGAVFDEAAIRDIALRADDLWLFVHELRLGMPVVTVDAPYAQCCIDGSQDCALCHENLDAGGNDVVLEKLFARFPEEHAKLLRAAAGNKVPQPLVEDAPSELDAVQRGFFRRLRERLKR